MSPDGVISIIYYSTPDNSITTPIYTCWVFSDDGATAFSNEQKLGENGGFLIDEDNGFLGDYQGLVSSFDEAYAFFCQRLAHGTNNDRQVYFEKFTTSSRDLLSNYVKTKVDQTDENLNSFGEFQRWNQGVYTSYTAPYDFIFDTGEEEVIKASQDYKNGSYEKYYNWHNTANIQNHQKLDVTAQTSEVISNFKSANEAELKTKNVTGGGSLIIGFRDPWLIDYDDGVYGMRNRGMDEDELVFNEYTNQIQISKSSAHNGIFLNQDPDDPGYYSVRAKVAQNITVHSSEEIPYHFQNWEHNANANPTQPDVIKPDPNTGINYYETPLVFIGDNGSVTAVYKGHRASQHSRATGYNGGRRITRTDDGKLHLVYQDDHKIWYTSSPDNGTSWSKEVCISVGSGDFLYPSIASYGNQLHVVWTNPMNDDQPHLIFYAYYNGSWSGQQTIQGVYFADNYYIGKTIPVIAVLEESGSPRPVIVYRTVVPAGPHNEYLQKIVSFKKTSSGWQEISIPDYGTNPSLCADSDHQKLGLVYEDYDNIYYNELTASGWGTRQNISGAGTDKNTSVSLLNGTAHVVWEGEADDGTDEVHYRELTNGDATSSATINAYAPGYGMGNPIVVSSPTTANAYNPSVGVYSNGDVAFFYNKGGEIYKKKKVGSTWYLYDYNRSGKYPSIIENGVKSAVYTKYNSAPYLLKSLYTEPSSGGQWGPYPIIGPQHWGGHHTESTVRFEFPIDSVQNGTRPGLITLDILNVSFVEDSLGMNQQLQSDTMMLSGPLQPLEIDLRVRFINVDNGFDDNTVLFKADFVENGQPTFLTDLRYHELPAAAGDSVERFFKLATIVNLAGHEGHLQLSLADITPKMYIIQNEDVDPLAKSVVEGFTRRVPQQYTLKQNFPNPFNPSTHITFELPQSEKVKLEVFDVKGQKVITLAEGQLDEGAYEVVFDGNGLSSGVYFYRLEAGNFVQTKRMLLIK